MATIGQLMNRDLSVMTEDTTVKQAAEQMHDQQIGSLLVKKGNDYSGIMTETDVVRAVAEHDNVAATSVVHVMSSPILTVEKKLSPHYARDLMANKRIRHLAVTDDGKIVGILSARDLLAYFKTVSKEVS
jgi:signal-transduction protein with cAMP-binding, CBS, and nucleotidyltransferase domain